MCRPVGLALRTCICMKMETSSFILCSSFLVPLFTLFFFPYKKDVREVTLVFWTDRKEEASLSMFIHTHTHKIHESVNYNFDFTAECFGLESEGLIWQGDFNSVCWILNAMAGAKCYITRLTSNLSLQFRQMKTNP